MIIMEKKKSTLPVFKVAFLLAGLIAIVVVGLSAIGPAKTEVERSIYINGKMQDLYAFLLDFRNYQVWQPAIGLDSAMTSRIEGPKGEGGKYFWSGNELVGSGNLEIVKADPYRFIEMRVLYTEPWEVEASYLFRLSPEKNGSKVTWRYEAKNAFLSRISLLFMNMDKLLGAELESGLEHMRSVYQDQQNEKTQ